jgi:hypothetical protein
VAARPDPAVRGRARHRAVKPVALGCVRAASTAITMNAQAVGSMPPDVCACRRVAMHFPACQGSSAYSVSRVGRHRPSARIASQTGVAGGKSGEVIALLAQRKRFRGWKESERAGGRSIEGSVS